jgi:xanthine dehydrogenase accessory factor
VRVGLESIRDNRSRLIRLSPEPGTKPVPDGIEEVPMTCFSGGTLDIFIEPHQPRARLIVAGSSPVADALVRLGRELDYHVIALDPDAAGNVAGADETLRDTAHLSARVTPLTFVVIATHGEFDEPALAAALRTDAPYVGLVASRRRGEAVRETLRAEGVGEDRLARLKFPAGLDIGARRGDEIALSILAELIQVRHTLEHVDWPHHKPPASTPARPRLPLATPSAATAIDPVCGMSVRTEGAQNTLELDGRTWYFCCGGCRARFAANPAAYLQT